MTEIIAHSVFGALFIVLALLTLKLAFKKEEV